ncbi:hypothetical protein GCM10023155_35110 [Bremerella cremea]
MESDLEDAVFMEIRVLRKECRPKSSSGKDAKRMHLRERYHHRIV